MRRLLAYLQTTDRIGMARWRYIMLGVLLLVSFFLATNVREQRSQLREQQVEQRMPR
jgi:hypothetical protein